ncbi:hypothetical protein OPV22_006890 [Ensete ventricosum]|uniref:Uncharacterized protein n=1 Tax=Ensete ventricosum TaxID=4639 RepID=A0AAV8RP20_ENSVE|nr:hypothetical protein OPV22_006890 [Ensete ventricosum]
MVKGRQGERVRAVVRTWNYPRNKRSKSNQYENPCWSRSRGGGGLLVLRQEDGLHLQGEDEDVGDAVPVHLLEWKGQSFHVPQQHLRWVVAVELMLLGNDGWDLGRIGSKNLFPVSGWCETMTMLKRD